MFVNKIKIFALSVLLVSFAFADMETKSIDLVSDFSFSVMDSKEPKLKNGHGSLSDFFPYPKSLKANGISGQVIVEFDVTPIGRVTNSKIVQSPSNELSEIVLSRIEFMEFNPGTQNGK
ncbi:MAG: TonB family protein, partial [Flavobacteriaceae bacterium]|nr:TonB family protein [Flavobacteriaceae bacterium]